MLIESKDIIEVLRKHQHSIDVNVSDTYNAFKTGKSMINSFGECHSPLVHPSKKSLEHCVLSSEGSQSTIKYIIKVIEDLVCSAKRG